MFGESESGESPAVPSPWDSLISLSLSPSPSPTPSPIPRLVPEAEEGNVEYKLQLLSPSPTRFARLVTQMKWRLLEGGGQAFYELGVADSGDLIGLPRVELEQSLETLEMMAGEIGASVIVVKEIEVPSVMVGLAASETDRWNRKRRKKREALDRGMLFSADEDDEEDNEQGEPVMFTMDVEIAKVDLEISSVYKPRPPRVHGIPRHHHHHHHSHAQAKKEKKRARYMQHLENGGAEKKMQKTEETGKLGRRAARDQRREEKRKALLAFAEEATAKAAESKQAKEMVTVQVEESIIAGVEDMLANVSLNDEINQDTTLPIATKEEDEDDVFPTPTPFPSTETSSTKEWPQARMIVEALVVRKMSLEEAFLDFGGFSLT